MALKKPVVIVGMGEIGGIFARGFLRMGHPVHPVTRQTSLTEMATAVPNPLLVLIAVAEADLQATLESIPSVWRNAVGLLQNELLPRDWQPHAFINPTVISIWFEKKPGQDHKVLLSSPAFGPQSEILVNALKQLNIPAHAVSSMEEMEYELVRKNIYILTTNICGLITGGTVTDLQRQNEALMLQVANDIIDIQQWLTGHEYSRARLWQGLLEGIAGDPQHKCMGRTAPARLQRALHHADAAKLGVNRLRVIHQAHLKSAHAT